MIKILVNAGKFVLTRMAKSHGNAVSRGSTVSNPVQRCMEMRYKRLPVNQVSPLEVGKQEQEGVEVWFR